MNILTRYPVLLFMLLLSACSLDPKAVIDPGDYTVTSDLGAANKVGRETIIKMNVDLETQQVTIFFTDGTQRTIAYTPRPASEWPKGCPTNIYSTQMEVFDLVVTDLEIGSLTIIEPILVRNCPEEPNKVILQEDGEIGGAGTGCLNFTECIFFEIQ